MKYIKYSIPVGIGLGAVGVILFADIHETVLFKGAITVLGLSIAALGVIHAIKESK